MDRELHTPGAVLDTSRSPHALLRPLPLGAMRVEGGFWAPRLERLRSVTLPQQHRQLEQSGRVDNFRRASGRRQVPFRGTYYDDSDVYKWMEAASYALATAPDRELRALLDGIIDEVAAAQRPDGYLSTYHTFEREGERYSDLENKHELYCAGHLIQAGVAHHRATGERSLLDVAVRAADHVCETFGPRGRAGAGGHEEIELALVELYRQTGDRTYLDRAGFFLDQRGAIPPLIGGRPYHQDHLPVREQREAMGHAVRLTYLACAMTDVAMETGDEGLSAASHALWESAFGRKAYITGALGSRYEGEAFGEDYELPNASSYAETCASIGGVMWNWRLLAMTGEARFAGWFETALYNGVLSGISLEGDAYFYANPLADRPAPSGEFAEPSIEQQRGSGQHRRQPWFACACCPPNIARLLASLPGYAYGMSDDGALWVHLYLDGWVRAPLPDGSEIAFGVETDYPWEGAVKLTINDAPDRPVALRLRVPGWARGASLSVNAQPVAGAVAAGEYATVERGLASGRRGGARAADGRSPRAEPSACRGQRRPRRSRARPARLLPRRPGSRRRPRRDRDPRGLRASQRAPVGPTWRRDRRAGRRRAVAAARPRRGALRHRRRASAFRGTASFVHRRAVLRVGQLRSLTDAGLDTRLAGELRPCTSASTSGTLDPSLARPSTSSGRAVWRACKISARREPVEHERAWSFSRNLPVLTSALTRTSVLG